MKPCLLSLPVFIFLLAGCHTVEEITPAPTSTLQITTATATIITTSTVTVAIPPTAAPTDSASPAPSATSQPHELCSPLTGYSFEDLELAIVNPYQPPPPGMDHPHQGVDLAVLEEGTRVAIAGDSVQAILSGVVSGILMDRFPYGNTIFIETLLKSDDVLGNYLDPLPTPWAEVKQDAALTCPDVAKQELAHERSSIYILYAHLLEPPRFNIGDVIQCGETIGKIGMSGNALNPHVHIEARLGASKVKFESMAHYDSSATQAEMSAYCQWRVSGVFQHFDPMLLQSRLSSTNLP